MRLRPCVARVAEERIPLTGLHRGVIPVGPVTPGVPTRSGCWWTERWSATAELLVLPRMVPVETLGAG